MIKGLSASFRKEKSNGILDSFKGFALVFQFFINIDYLREKYIDQRNQIEELEEEIACLRVDNRALADTLEKVLPKED